VPRRRDDSDESIGAFMTRRFGSEATTYLAEPLLAGIHAGDVNRLSAQALFPRLVSAERQVGSLLRAFRSTPETRMPNTAGSWLSSKWPHRAPEDRVLLRTFLGGARDPDALDRPDEDLIAHSIAALRPLIGIRGEALFTRVYRWVRGNAQHEVGHLARMAA